jgi:hypothetical protein
MGIEFFKASSNLMLVRPQGYNFPTGLTSFIQQQAASISSIDYLLVGGGGGAAQGGGGAGGYISGTLSVNPSTNYSVGIGGGGPGQN